MDGKFLGDYASPLHDFYKPIVVGFSISEGATAAQVAEIIAEKIKLAIPDNNKFINVENTKGNAVITVTLTDYYMFVKKENVVLQKLVLPACGETCIGEYEEVEGVTFNETQKAQQPFATGTWLIENQRIPNSSNFRYFGLNGEMPIANAKYVQYTFDYAQDRPGLGGHSGVGQNITAITNHTFFVIDSAAKSFETAFAGAKGGFAGDALEE